MAGAMASLPFLGRLGLFFTPPQAVNLHALEDAAIARASERVSQTTGALADAVNSHKSVELDVTIRAPRVLVPERVRPLPAQKARGTLLVVADLGELTVSSRGFDEAASSARKERVKRIIAERGDRSTAISAAMARPSAIGDPSALEDDEVTALYDRVRVRLRDLQVLLTRDSIDWRAAVRAKRIAGPAPRPRVLRRA